MSKKTVRPSTVESKEIARAAESAPRPFQAYHAVLIVALGVLVAAQYWLGREMFERYRFNVIRHPQVAQQSQWARMTGWMPQSHRLRLSRLVLGSLLSPLPATLTEYVDRLHKVADIFPYDGILQLELSRNLYEQVQRRTTLQLDQALDLLRQALEHNRRAFETYFDVEAYNQTAWIQMELHGLQLAAKRKPEADASLQAAIEGFHRVLVLNPGDADALEHLAYIYSYIASASQRSEDWLASLDYAKRLLEVQHDNTNAFYFMGIAYESLALQEHALICYVKTLTYPSTMPNEKRMWDRKVILDHLAAFGYTAKLPPEQGRPTK